MMQTVDFSQTKVLGGFWKQKQDMVRKTTIYAVYDRFVETGRFDAFQFNWKEGMPHKPDIFWDSDVAKWMEAAAYLTWQKREPKLEKLVDNTVDLIEKNQCEDGYFNVYFTIVEPDKRFSDRRWHELYCAGHLIEAAVAYYEATGKRKFLDCMCRYADYIEKHFKIDQDTPFSSPGHEEIELALVRLFECTGEKRYLDLAEYFVLIRGTEADKGKDTLDGGLYSQAHKPAAQQDEAEGHAVRAVYFYCAMADIAYHTGNQELLAACRKLFADIITKKMYITGGIGSSSRGEAFTLPYDLNNELAYAETCAAIGLAFFANRMLKLENDSVYSDTIERIIYNGFLSSTSLDGKAFFYENPLEIIPMMSKRDRSCTWIPGIHWPQTQRSEVFECSCCPPNINRIFSSLADLFFKRLARYVVIIHAVPLPFEYRAGCRADSTHKRVRAAEDLGYNGALAAAGGTGNDKYHISFLIFINRTYQIVVRSVWDERFRHTKCGFGAEHWFECFTIHVCATSYTDFQTFNIVWYCKGCSFTNIINCFFKFPNWCFNIITRYYRHQCNRF